MSIATALYRLATFFHIMFLTGPNRKTSKIYAIANVIVIVIVTVSATISGAYLRFQFLFSLTNISVLKMCNLHDTNLFFMRRASLKLPSMHVYITFYLTHKKIKVAQHCQVYIGLDWLTAEEGLSQS